MAAEVWERSGDADEAQRYVMYVILKHVDSALKNNRLYTEHTKWEKWVLYKLHSPKLPAVFKSLSDSITSVLRIAKPEILSRVVVEIYKQRMVVGSRPHQETPVSSIIKRKDVVFAVSLFWFCDSDRINITVLRARGLSSMMLSHLNK